MSSADGTAPVATNQDKALADMYADMDRHHLFGFWAVSTEKSHDEVERLKESRRAVPHVWRYKDIEPILHTSAELITMENSERRSLILVNPGLAPSKATTTTLYTAYRLNDPNEIMPPHRHSPNAVRFGLTGKQNFTGVEGENITFGPGDLVLTPHDTWHNHGNVGDEPAINVSVLDLPLVETLNAMYFEHDYTEEIDGQKVRKKIQSARFAEDYSEAIYGAGGLRPRFVGHHRGTGNASPMYVYRWEAMQRALERLRDYDGSPYEGISIEYTDPLTGASPYKTTAFFAQLMRPGEKLLPSRQGASLICTVFEGRGHSIIGGTRYDWDKFDTFAVPGGTWCQHVNDDPDNDAILFVASDEPTLKALGFYRRLGRTASGEVVRID
ncbi:MAG: cupin domain-containing protein [Rhodospirillales bacterium]